MDKFCLNDYQGKKVLVTGHTGFKGSWLCQMLIMAGADVVGYSLEPDGSNVVYKALGLESRIKSFYSNIKDLALLRQVFEQEQPQYVFHLAAQPLVLKSYQNPVDTYETNVMGTVNICECIRHSQSVVSFVNVTTDKVYENKEQASGYKEDETLNGHDPYSNSKSCSELVTSSYVKSFFCSQAVAASTARAGNVIGGGDRCENRILPDCVKDTLAGQKIVIRNPHSVRPYQHVIEPLYAYIMIGMQQSKRSELSGRYNVGPKVADCVSTKSIAEYFCGSWQGAAYTVQSSEGQPHEANFLRLDASLIEDRLGWRPLWSTQKAVMNTVAWERAYAKGEDMVLFSADQISEYVKEALFETKV